MSPREHRAYKNEALFREVNLHITELQDGSLSLVEAGLMPLICECAETGCTTPIEVEPVTFERVRASPRQFLVAPGHERLTLESVVERREGYLIVEKHVT